MTAYIAPSAGKAAIVSGDRIELFQVGKDAPVIINQQTFDHIFSACDDILQYEDLAQEQLLQTLEIESNKSTALLMLLTILNAEIKAEQRIPLEKRLNAMFASHSYVEKYLANIMYAKPLPDDCLDLFSINIDELQHLKPFLLELYERQVVIKQVCEDFSLCCAKHDFSQQLVDFVYGCFVNSGYFYYLTKQKILKLGGARYKRKFDRDRSLFLSKFNQELEEKVGRFWDSFFDSKVRVSVRRVEIDAHGKFSDHLRKVDPELRKELTKQLVSGVPINVNVGQGSLDDVKTFVPQVKSKH